MSETSGEPDFTQRTKSAIDLWYIKGVLLKDPYVIKCVPCSIENLALAYDAINDRFNVNIKDATGITLTDDVSDRWARLLGAVDLARVAGAAISLTNPVWARLSNGSIAIDPRDRNWTVSETLTVQATAFQIRALAKATDWLYATLKTDAGVALDPRDRNWTISETLTVQATNFAIRALAKATDNVYATLKTDAGVAIDPRDRNWLLGSSDIPDLLDKWARQLGQIDLARILGAAASVTNPLPVRITDGSAFKDPTLIRALTSADVVTAQQTTRTSMTVKPEREDLTSLGATATLTGGTGLQIVPPSGSLKPKIYDADFEVVAAGLHCFYFGTTTTLSSKRILSRTTVGPILKSLFHPRVGAAGDGIYLYSAVNDTVPYDLGYVLE